VGGLVEALSTNPFLRNALLTALLSSLACGIVGSYVVTRRITYIAGGIAHCVLGGLGAAYYVRVVYGVTWLEPLHGAIVAALAAAAIIGVVSLRARQREDTVISALWAIGMATGLLFIAGTPGYKQDLMSYLFGSISMVSPRDLWLIVALDAGVVVTSLLFFNKLQAVCFDEEFARLRGIRVEVYYLLLLGLTALTVVLLVSVVGIVLVIALLSLPAAVAGHFSRTLRQMMVLATLLSAVFTTVGIAVSYQPDLPSGAVIIVLAGAAYIGVAVWKAIPRRRRAS
jgi:zinc transport system permease protein